MERIKEYLWEKIKEEIENSNDEKIKNFIKAFKNKEDFINYVKFYSNLSFDDMKRVSGLGYYIRKIKYHHTPRLLGNQTKAIPEEIFQKLINYVEKNYGKKLKLALMFEGIQGARGEDTVRLKVEHLDFTNHNVKIYNRKRDRWYELPLNRELEQELKEFISQNRKEIEKHKGYVFFSSNPFQIRNHISQKYLKNLVYKVLKKLGLNKVYAKSSDGRNLYLYTLHSLRGHAASRINKKTHDIKIVQELLDHEPTSADTTLLYLEKDEEKLRKSI